MVEKVSDFVMPEKVVTRLLRDALPDNVLISKDAKNAACRSASIFILQLSIAAAEKAQMSNRRTLENQDIIKAVTDLGLGEYAPQLVRFGAQRKRNAKRRESTIQKSKSSSKKSTDEPDQYNQQPHAGEQLQDSTNDQSCVYQTNQNNSGPEDQEESGSQEQLSQEEEEEEEDESLFIDDEK